MISKILNNINVLENDSANTLLPTPIASVPVNYAQLTFTISSGYKVKGDTNLNLVPVLSGNVVTTNGLLNIVGTLLTP